MQANAMAEKHKIEWDNFEHPGLVNVNERAREKAGVDVSSFDRTRTISNGVIKIPILEVTYRVDRGTSTLPFFEKWFLDNLVKDGVLTKYDAHGAEFERILLPKCECLKNGDPAYDASAPEYAKIMITIAPWDYIPIDI